MNAIEIKEKLKLVNKIIRNFETYQMSKADMAREVFNNIIGIYK